MVTKCKGEHRRYQVKFIMKGPKAVVPKVPNHLMSVCDEIPLTNHRDKDVGAMVSLLE